MQTLIIILDILELSWGEVLKMRAENNLRYGVEYIKTDYQGFELWKFSLFNPFRNIPTDVLV